MKVYLTIITILLIACFFFGIGWQKEKNTRVDMENTIMLLKGQKNLLEEEIKKRNQDAIELQKKYKELEKAANDDKGFDWMVDISNTAVIRRLQAN